jgi:hypothetical protein
MSGKRKYMLKQIIRFKSKIVSLNFSEEDSIAKETE